MGDRRIINNIKRDANPGCGKLEKRNSAISSFQQQKRKVWGTKGKKYLYHKTSHELTTLEAR